MVAGAKFNSHNSARRVKVDFYKWPPQEKFTYLRYEVEVASKIGAYRYTLTKISTFLEKNRGMRLKLSSASLIQINIIPIALIVAFSPKNDFFFW